MKSFLSILLLLIPWFFSQLPELAAEGDWLEVAAPGSTPDIGFSATKKGVQPVLDLTPFAGRLYISLAPKIEPTFDAPIISYDPAKQELIEETITQSAGFGNFRLLDKKLFLPDAAPSEGADGGGYYVSEGKGDWKRIAVMKERAAFFDISQFADKTFLAGSLDGKGIVAWRAKGDEQWQIVELTKQAARWSPLAARFLVDTDHLTLLAERQPDPNPMARVAPQAWGAWYVLHYYPGKSDRGFIFDGPPRPLPSLRLLAPGSRLPDVGHLLAHDVPFSSGLLYTIVAEGGAVRDEKGGLFHAKNGKGNAQVGRTFIARRIPGMDGASDVAVEQGRCYVLLADNAQKKGRIVATSDLRKWDEIYAGQFDASPISLGVISQTCYVGLADGTIAMILTGK